MTLHIPEIDPDGGTIAAALAYAAAGWYVLPVDPGTKHAGSVLGRGWPAKSSRDPERIADWFLLEPHALALHAGRSGAVVFDVDAPGALPDVLADAFAAARPPHQSTRADVPGRGHYLFALPPGRMFGNSAAGLGGGAWGDVRGKNGVIVVAPSPHAKAAGGGRYAWERTGPLPGLPGPLAALLRDAGESAGAATDPEVRAFLAAHTGAARPELLRALAARFTADVAAGRSRHESMLLPCANAMREARAGMYPAWRAAETLRALFVDATSRSRDGTRRVLSPSAAAAEFAGILAWAVAQARSAPAAEIRAVLAGVAERAPAEAAMIAEIVPPTTPSADPTAVADGAMATVHPLTADQADTDEPRERTSWWPRPLTGVLSGAEEEPPPALLARADGVHLWYPGKINGLLGESESGKTWVALLGVAQALADGQRVTYLDFEDTATGIVARLRALGVPDSGFDRLDYIGPDEALHLEARSDLTEYIDDADPGLAVVDGVNAAMTLMGLDLNSNTDATRFTQTLLKPLAARGAAVVAIDHVPKSKEGRGKGGIGAQAKRAMMTGCALTVEVAEPFGRGMTGRLRLYVDKDRPGFVRAKCAEAKYAGTAVLESDIDSGGVRVTIHGPDGGTGAGVPPLTGPQGRRRRLMADVAAYLAADPDRTSLRGIREAVKGRPADVAEALEALVRDGHVVRTGSGNRFAHTLIRPFPDGSHPCDQARNHGNHSGTTPEITETGKRDTHALTGDGPPRLPVVPPGSGNHGTAPGRSGSVVPTPSGGNHGTVRGRPTIVVIDGRIIATDGAILTRHGDDLVDTATGEVRGTVADLPAGAA